MGFFDMFTDAFTGAPAKAAAGSTRDYLTGVQGAGTSAINTGQANSLTALGQGYNTAVPAITGGYDRAAPYFDRASAAYDPLAGLGSKYGRGTDLYLNSLGVNGAAGNDAAVNAFHAGPGYNFALDQGIEGINRSHNAGHMLASGNTDRDATKFAEGLADQEYGRWQDRLGGLVNPELSATGAAATGRAGVAGNQAGAAINEGGQLSNLATNYGGQQADTYGRGVAQTLGLNQSIADPYAKSYGQEAAAEQQGSANLWNLGLNLAKLGVGGYGAYNGSKPTYYQGF